MQWLNVLKLTDLMFIVLHAGQSDQQRRGRPGSQQHAYPGLMAVNYALPSHPDAIDRCFNWHNSTRSNLLPSPTFRQIISEKTNVSASTNIIQSFQYPSSLRTANLREEEPAIAEIVKICHLHFDRISVPGANKIVRKHKGVRQPYKRC
jgi:hypothetical protein